MKERKQLKTTCPTQAGRGAVLLPEIMTRSLSRSQFVCSDSSNAVLINYSFLSAVLFEVNHPDNEPGPYLQSTMARAIRLFFCFLLTLSSSTCYECSARSLTQSQSHNTAIDTRCGEDEMGQ